jgi:biopolymer transport protein ExbD
MKIPSKIRGGRPFQDNEFMTPMIDIVFQLLIFFIIAAAGQVREAVLPTEISASGQVPTDSPAERDPWLVDVWLRLRTNAQGRTLVTMNERPFEDLTTLAEPLSTLASLTPETPVILQIADDVPMQDVITVYDLCRRSGFESVNFAAQAADLGLAP